MKPLRVATVGAGYFSRFHYDAWSRIGDVELVGISNRDQARAKAFADEFNIPEIFSNVEVMLDRVQPDLLDIITPPETHLAFIQAAVSRSVPVICQKPFCRSLEEAYQAVERAAVAKVPIIVHENFRFQPWYRETKKLLTSGRFGKLYSMTFRLRPGDGQGPSAYLDRQPYFQKMNRFLVHETAIHLIDTFRYLLGDAQSVYADLRQLNPVISGEDAGLILMDHGDGVRSLFDGNRLSDHVAENRRLTMGEIILEGSGGTLRLDGGGRLLLRHHSENDEFEHEYAWQNSGFGGDCVYNLQRHVVDHVRGRGPVENTASEYLRNLEIEEAVYQSSEQGRKIILL